jgi:hypothetical protein
MNVERSNFGGGVGWGGDVSQAVERLPSKREALNSNPEEQKKKKVFFFFSAFLQGGSP